MKDNRYKRHHELFESLIASIDGIFPQRDLIQVREFIDHNELGLALQTVIDASHEEGVQLSSEAAAICLELAELMGGKAGFERLEQVIHMARSN